MAAPIAGVPITGSVSFSSRTVNLGTATIVSGVAILSPSISALTTGSQTITAAYSGDANYGPVSSTLTQTVNPATTSVAVISNNPGPGINQPVTFYATIARQYPATLTGSVAFFANGVQIGSPVGVSAQQASLTTSFSSASVNAITANYSGDTNFLPGISPPLSQDVKQTTTSAVSISPAGISYGAKVVITATVTGPHPGPTPTGTVTFKNASSAIGTGTLSGGVATFTSTNLPVGADSISASYNGDAVSFTSNSSPVTENVAKASTTTSQRTPVKITLDAYAASHRAVTDLKDSGYLPKRVQVRTSKYLNNVIEQDHRRVKQRLRPMLGLKSLGRRPL